MDKTFWLRRARREALRFNLGWWVQMFLPWIIAAGVIAAIAVLALRSANQQAAPAALAAAGIILLGTIAALIIARKKFLTRGEALTRLDADLSLKNRLTSAAEGIGEWPATRPAAKAATGAGEEVDAAAADAAAHIKPDRIAPYKTIGAVTLSVSIFNPPGHAAATPKPGIVFFHGGGFNVGASSPRPSPKRPWHTSQLFWKT